MLNPLRTPVVFLALTLMLAGWLFAWTLPTHSMWWSLNDRRPEWLELRQHRPLFWLACTSTGTSGRGHSIRATASDSYYTGPVVIETESGIRVVRAQALSVILESESVIAASYEIRRNRIDEFGLLAFPLIRWHAYSEIMPLADLPPLSFEQVRRALASAYPEMGASAGMSPRTRWHLSSRAIVHDGMVLIALVIWFLSATGIPKWSIWKRAGKNPL
jgi:hypothetical protein